MNNKFIVTSDWHLRYDKPRCRLDEDWIETQRKTIQFVYDEAIKRSADIIICGDLFHEPKPRNPQELEIMIIKAAKEFYEKTNKYTYIIIGNHSLLYHNIKNKDKGSIGVILASGYFKLLSQNGIKINDVKIKGYSYGEC